MNISTIIIVPIKVCFLSDFAKINSEKRYPSTYTKIIDINYILASSLNIFITLNIHHCLSIQPIYSQINNKKFQPQKAHTPLASSFNTFIAPQIRRVIPLPRTHSKAKEKSNLTHTPPARRLSKKNLFSPHLKIPGRG